MVVPMKKASEEGVGVQIRPYTNPSEWCCPQCGVRINWFERFVAWVRSSFPGIAAYSFCEGGKEPTQGVGLGEMLATGKTERLNPCAGVLEPHLHVRCRFCGYQDMMRTKGGRL